MGLHRCTNSRLPAATGGVLESSLLCSKTGPGLKAVCKDAMTLLHDLDLRRGYRRKAETV